MPHHPPITDAAEAARLLGSDHDERVICTITPSGIDWHLHRANRQIAASTISILLQCGPTLSPNPGTLIASNDGLFGDRDSTQTYVWQPLPASRRSAPRRKNPHNHSPRRKPEAQSSAPPP